MPVCFGLDVRGVSTPRSPCKIHFFAPHFTKDTPPAPLPHPRNRFCVEGDFPRRREDRAEDNEAEKKGNGVGERYTGASEMNESLRRGNGEKSRDYPSGRSKGLSEAKLRFPKPFLGARPSPREILALCHRAGDELAGEKVLPLSNDGIYQTDPKLEMAPLSTSTAFRDASKNIPARY